MTSIVHRYADFSDLDLNGEMIDPVPLEKVEDEKLQSFEEGYQAGWTDAEKNYETEQKGKIDEVLYSLRDISIAHQDALGHLQRRLRPLFEKLISQFVPDVSDAAFQAYIVTELMKISNLKLGSQACLRVCEADLPMIERILDDADLKIAVTLIGDSRLGAHSLILDDGCAEQEINLGAVTHEIIAGLRAFNFHSKPETPDA